EMFDASPVIRLSMQMTVCPSARSRSQRCEPRNPAPPVTTLTRSAPGTVRAPPHAEIVEPLLGEDRRVVDVPSVEDDMPAHERFHPVEVGPAEDIPFREDQKSVGAPEGGVVVFKKLHRVAEVLSRLLERDRVVGMDRSAAPDELPDNRNAW